jgi:hypothetical protein
MVGDDEAALLVAKEMSTTEDPDKLTAEDWSTSGWLRVTISGAADRLPAV